MIAEAEQSGVLGAQSDTPLSIAERTISVVEFEHTWDARRAPCRTLNNLWSSVTSSDTRTRAGMSVATALATQMVNERRPEHTIQRQLMRVSVACRLEQRFTDTQMLRAWLRGAYFGLEPFGIEHASQTLFGKPAAALNVEESARIAALMRAPSVRSDPARWEERARYVRERVAAAQQP